MKTSLVPKKNQVEKLTLADFGIDKKLSSRVQKLAAVPEGEFQTMLTSWRISC